MLPDGAGKFQLEDPALVRMQKIIARRDSLGALRSHRTPLPPGRADTAAVLISPVHELNSVVNTVFHTRGPRRH